MRWNKVGIIGLLLVLFLLAGLPHAMARSEIGPSGQNIWDTILKIGSLGYLCNLTLPKTTCQTNENDLVALMRVLIGILTFALFYMGASAVPGLNEQKNIAITVSIILAIMSVIFIPSEVLIGIGAAYSTIVSVILIGAPIVGGLLLFRMVPGDSRGGIGMRIIILLLLIFVLTAVKNYAGGLL